MKNIYLIGMRGVGKTSVGRILAKKRNATFIDLDKEIAKRELKSLPEMIHEKGWEAFREKEKLVLDECLKQENIVLSTGGGVLMFFDNAEKLQRRGILVLLTASPETLAERLKDCDDRPSLTGKDCIKELKDVWNEREPTYRRHAQMTVDTENQTPEQVAEEIVLRLDE